MRYSRAMLDVVTTIGKMYATIFGELETFTVLLLCAIARRDVSLMEHYTALMLSQLATRKDPDTDQAIVQQMSKIWLNTFHPPKR